MVGESVSGCEPIKNVNMETDNIIKIGDTVELLCTNRHNSNCKNYNNGISFDNHEIGNIIEILDIVTDSFGKICNKVKCDKGITFLKRIAFKPIEKLEIIDISSKKDYDYLIPILIKYNLI